MTKTKVPQYKLKAVKELSDLIKEKKTVLVVSIKNIPGSQFQEIVKKLRGKAIVKVPKKRMILKAIDNSKIPEMIELKESLDDSFAILFSDVDSFELAGDLLKSTSPAKAKPGQEAPEDITVEEGPTDLVPGPAISELGALGIQIQIDKGKIAIKQSKVIAKKGEKISQGAADLMTKLDIKPFTIGFIPVCSFDSDAKKFYAEIKIDTAGTLAMLKDASAKSLSFAVGINYLSKDTIKVFISKAGAQANKLNRIFTGEPQEVASTSSRPEPVAEVVDEKTENTKEKPEEEKAAAAEGLGALFG